MEVEDMQDYNRQPRGRKFIKLDCNNIPNMKGRLKT